MNQLFPRFVHRFFLLYAWLTRPLTLGVRLILVTENQVLLVKHTYQNLWFLPGGGVEKGETLEQAARREAQEELGAQLGPLTILGIYTNFFDFKSDHVVVFVCQDFTFQPRPNPEIAASQFFPLDQLPSDLAAGHRRRLEEYQGPQASASFGLW